MDLLWDQIQLPQLHHVWFVMRLNFILGFNIIMGFTFTKIVGGYRFIIKDFIFINCQIKWWLYIRANVGQYKMNLTLFFHTYTILFNPIIFIIVLSDYKTVFQSSTVHLSCGWANSRCLWQWVFINMGIFFFVTDQKSLLESALLTILGCTGCRGMELMKWMALTAISSLPDWI